MFLVDAEMHHLKQIMEKFGLIQLKVYLLRSVLVTQDLNRDGVVELIISGGRMSNN